LQAELLQWNVSCSSALQKKPGLYQLRPEPDLQAPAQRLAETVRRQPDSIGNLKSTLLRLEKHL
jgi:hypothetical protein